MSSLLSRCRSGGAWGARCKKAVQLLGCLLGVLLLSLPAFSQGSTGRILGTVTDTSGGVVAGATVTVLDTQRGVSRTLITDDAGAYSAPNLTPGNYTVRAEAKGFKKLERQNVVVEVGHEVRVDLVVQPGEQTQTVTVTESVPLVETTNATMGGTLENTDIIDLPLNGRDYQNLMGLRPGVMLQPGGGPWTQSANGARPDESVWMVEGIINSNFFDARPVMNMPSPFTDAATILPVDAVQEFNIMENPKAEYGWKTGAIVNVGIKSGTNQFHGDAYAFGRYQNWDARNYFNIGTQGGSCALGLTVFCDQTPAQLKQFGATVGGPIKKDKLFFFGGYEGLRSFIGFVGGLPVPATQATGDPSASMVDAITALQNAGITPSPVSLALAGCTPGSTPTCTGGLFPSSGTSTNFLSTFPTTNVSDNGIGKLDYHPNDKNSISGMFFLGNYTAPGEDHPFTNVAFTNNTPIRTWSDTASWVYTPNSTMVNEMRFGYNRVSFQFVNVDVNVPANGTGYPINTGITNPLAGGLPSITIKGFGTGGTPVLGTAFNRPQYFSPNPYYDFQDAVSVLKGKHSFKFGFEFAHTEADAQVFNNGRGRFDFLGGAAFTSPMPSTALEDFFAGALSDGRLLSGTPLSALTSMTAAGFIQDDWRVTPKLIVNLGLRYVYNTPLKDANNNLGTFDPNIGMVQQGHGIDSLWSGDHRDFEPRVGFAWDINGNGTTVIRGGAGLVHETWVLETFEGQFGIQSDNSVAINAVPTGATITCDSAFLSAVGGSPCPANGGGTIGLASLTLPSSSLCWDASITSGPAFSPACAAGQTTVFPGATSGPTCGDGVGLDPTPCDIMGTDPHLKLPFVVNYNIGVTHAFTPNLSVEVEYVGNRGYRLLNFGDINQAPLGSAYCLNTLTAAQTLDACAGGPLPVGSPSAQASQEARPYFKKFPYLGFINDVTNRSFSRYNSLQVTVTKRMSHGLAFTAGYTYGHGLDNGSLNRFGTNPQDSTPAGLLNEYASNDFDIRHRLTVTATYNIPGVKGYGQLLEGWQINTIVNVATAQPWNTFDPGNNFSGTGENADRWSIFGNPADFTSGKRSFDYCTAGGCSYATVYGSTPSTNNYGKCVAAAPDPNTLASQGCYVSPNGNSVIVPPALGTFGNMGRNIFRDSGFKTMDFSVFKNFTFKERYGIQARWEIFNVLNHPIAANPSGASSFVNSGNSPGGGAPLGASFLTPDFAAGNPLIGSGSQRVMQVGLKLTF
jgi:Carboxypeptidase regulatory-like domain